MREFLLPGRMVFVCLKGQNGFVVSLPDLATAKEGRWMLAQIKTWQKQPWFKMLIVDLISGRGAGIPRFAIPCRQVLVSEGRVTCDPPQPGVL